MLPVMLPVMLLLFRRNPHAIPVELVRGWATALIKPRERLVGGVGCLVHAHPHRRPVTSTAHANVHNHFNFERHLVDRSTFKQRRSVALAKWQSLFS
jgi:hypothetical protein